MFLIDWFYSLLEFLGIYERITGTLLLLGLDNAGKTTLLYKLKYGTMSVHLPTTMLNEEQIKVGKCTFRTLDIGGHETLRNAWNQYYVDVGGVIFIIDAADTKRFKEAKITLEKVMMDDNLKGVPIAILANKIDLRKAVSGREFINYFELNECEYNDRNPMKVFFGSVKENMGIQETFEWMGEKMLGK